MKGTRFTSTFPRLTRIPLMGEQLKSDHLVHGLCDSI